MTIARGLTVILILLALTGDASAQTSAGTIKRIQDRWMQCLKSSFQINRKQVADPNAAAELAFGACATEEEELWSMSVASGVPRSSFAGLKSAMKQVLMEGTGR
jgi:hypothetical protein